MKLTPEQQQFIKLLTDQGYHVQLDRNGDVLFATYWHPELLVSKIIPAADGYRYEVE
jgi:hypothetical protein